MKRSGTKFGRKMEEGVAALLGQPSVETAARSVSISTRTMLRWMKEAEFQAAYREAKRAAFSQAVARLQQATPLAVATLIKLMADPTTPASVRR